MNLFPGFKSRKVRTSGATINLVTGGSGPAVLLLHGYPETHVLWHKVAPALARDYTVVCADLRGYGDSAKPPGDADHANYSKRAMALDMAELMAQLGHDRFALVGHDRGGRVAHRLALDHAQRVTRLCLIDIAPTLDMYDATDMRFASLYYHWFHLIQPAPLPERMLGGDPKFCLHWALGGWGSKGTDHWIAICSPTFACQRATSDSLCRLSTPASAACSRSASNDSLPTLCNRPASNASASPQPPH